MSLSRLCRKPISFDPAQVSLQDLTLLVKGDHGEIELDVNPAVNVNLDAENKTIQFTPIDDSDCFSIAISGTMTAHFNNMVQGVVKKHQRQLIINGIGYKASYSGDTLTLNLGFSHPVIMKIPKGIDIVVDKKNSIFISGVDKQIVGQVSADIRSKRPVEPYKQKGIRYSDEYVIRKEGKKK